MKNVSKKGVNFVVFKRFGVGLHFTFNRKWGRNPLFKFKTLMRSFKMLGRVNFKCLRCNVACQYFETHLDEY